MRVNPRSGEMMPSGSTISQRTQVIREEENEVGAPSYRELHRPTSAGEQRIPRNILSGALHRAVAFALAFAGLSALVAFGATRAVDKWVLFLTHSAAWYPLDVASSTVTILGDFTITGAIALMLALAGWRCDGLRGLTPLLLFVGVALEAGLKHYLPYPVLPHEFARDLGLASFVRVVPHFSLVQIALPYSFPSGHMIRTTFLAAFVWERRPCWRPFCKALVVVMAGTRLYLNDHWLSDVSGGMLLGLALAAAATAVNPSFPTPKQRKTTPPAEPIS